MRRLFIRLIGLAVILAMLLGTSRALGNTSQSFSIGVLSANRCALPCWGGVQPGQTTLEQADVLLNADPLVLNVEHATYPDELCWSTLAAPFWRSCARRPWSTAPGSPIDRISLELPPDALQLGEAILLWGQPLGLEQCPALNTRRAGMPHRYVATYLVFEHNIRAMAYDADQPDSRRLGPQIVILRLFYYAADQPASLAGLSQWEGFTGAVDLKNSCKE